MTRIVEKDNSPRDYYEASFESGSLLMTPCCACGNRLGEDYFCEKCNRKCRCRRIICRDQATLNRVKHYIRKSSQFSGLTVTLSAEG
jgi:hypothetical protein